MNIITRFWNGNLCPVKNLGKNNCNITELEELLDRNYERLESELTNSGKKILSIYYSCIEEYIALMTEEAFSCGFSIGVQMIAEAMGDCKNRE